MQINQKIVVYGVEYFAPSRWCAHLCRLKNFVKYNSTYWVDSLSKIIEQYNNSPHSSINDIKPIDADKPESISKIIDLNVEKRKEKQLLKMNLMKAIKLE